MASALDTVRAGIEAAVAALSLSSAPISWPGVDFAHADPGAPWVRADIVWGSGRMVSGGTGVTGNAVTGVLKIKLYGPPGEGLGALYDLADVVRDGFTRRTIGTAYFFAPSGPRDASEDAWAGVIIDCPFEVREA